MKIKNEMLKKAVIRAAWLITDAVLVALGIYLAVILRYNGNVWPALRHRLIKYYPLMVFIYVLMLNVFGAYRVKWKYVDIRDILRVLLACFTAAVISFVINKIFKMAYPQLVMSISGIICFLLLVSFRYLKTALSEFFVADRRKITTRRTLISGADSEGIRLVDIVNKKDDGAKHETVGFIDDDMEKIYRKYSGVLIEGTGEDIEQIIAEKRVTDVLFTESYIKAGNRKNTMLRALAAGCRVFTVHDDEFKPLNAKDIIDGIYRVSVKPDMLKGRRLAFAGLNLCASETAAMAKSFGADAVYVLDGSAKLLAKLKYKLGSAVSTIIGNPHSQEDIIKLIEESRCDTLIYAAGLYADDVAEGNSARLFEYNYSAPVNAHKLSNGKKIDFVFLKGACMGTICAAMENAAQAVMEKDDANVLTAEVSALADFEYGRLGNIVSSISENVALTIPKNESVDCVSPERAAEGLINLIGCKKTGAFRVKSAERVDAVNVYRALACQAGVKSTYRVIESESEDITAQNPPEQAGNGCVYALKPADEEAYELARLISECDLNDAERIFEICKNKAGVCK